MSKNNRKNNLDDILLFYRCILSYFDVCNSQKTTKRILLTIKIGKKIFNINFLIYVSLNLAPS
jgi:hypothetical protein